MNAYIISVSSSIVASLVWWFLTSITGNSKKVANIFKNAYDSASAFENAITYRDYDTAVLQCDRTIDLLYKAYDNIRLLTFRPQKKHLIMTYIYNNLVILSIFKNRSVGFDNEDEKIARMEKMEKNLFHFVPGINEPTTQGSLVISISLLTSLSVLRKIKTSFQINSLHNNQNVFINLVDINSFKTKTCMDWMMKQEGMTKEKYINLIKNIYSGKNSFVTKIIRKIYKPAKKLEIFCD